MRLNYVRKISLMLLALMFCLLFAPIIASASDLDSLGGGSNTTQNSNTDTAMSDYLKNYEPVTGENMQKAGTLASPIANALGTLTGFIMIITSAGIFVVTALDLMYIGIPFTREYLAPGVKGDSASGGAMGGGMGMQMQQQQQSQGGGKSAITTYLIKRSFFLVVFAICSVVLLSSIFTDCGINLAALIMKVMNTFNGNIQNVQI